MHLLAKTALAAATLPLALAPAADAQAPAHFHVSLHATTWHPLVGHDYVVKGTVKPRTGGHVVVQRKFAPHGTWYSVQRTALSSRGHYQLVIHTTKVQHYWLRAVKAGQGRVHRGVSDTHRVSVQPCPDGPSGSGCTQPT